jgi:hypothetical protein
LPELVRKLCDLDLELIKCGSRGFSTTRNL